MCCRCARSVSVSRSTTDGFTVSVPLICEVVITAGSCHAQCLGYHILAVGRILACRGHSLRLINLDVGYLNAIVAATVVHLHRIVIITCHISLRNITIIGCATDSHTILIPLISSWISRTFGHTHRQSISCTVQTVVRIGTVIGQRKRLINANVGDMHGVVIATVIHLYRIVEVACHSGERSITIGSSTANSYTILVPLVVGWIGGTHCHTHGEGFRTGIQTIICIRINIGKSKCRIYQYFHGIRLVINSTAIIAAGRHHISIRASCCRYAADGVLAIVMAGQCQTICRKVWQYRNSSMAVNNRNSLNSAGQTNILYWPSYHQLHSIFHRQLQGHNAIATVDGCSMEYIISTDGSRFKCGVTPCPSIRSRKLANGILHRQVITRIDKNALYLN